MDEITKYITSHANLVVAVLLAVIALTVVIFGAIVTMWIKPKLDLLDTLRGDVLLRSTTAATHALDLRINALETTTNAFPDLGALKGAVETLSATHTQEKLAQDKELKRMRKIILNTSANMRDLGRRSLEAGKEMLEARHNEYAREQAEQDVILSRTNMQLSRLTPEALPAASKMYEDALARRDKLFADAKIPKPIDSSFLDDKPDDDE